MRKQELKKMRIGVISGGDSPEREISIMTGNAVFSALRRIGYNAVLISADKNLIKNLLRLNVDVVFNALHGGYGENGTVQGVLEVLGIPYTGSGLLASALCMDKKKTKEVLIANHIPTPSYFVIDKKELNYRCKLTLPVVVKPVDAGSSIGVTIVRKKEDFSNAVKKALRYSKEVIVEDFIPGKEITVGILNDSALGAMEVVPKGDFLSYKVKYTPGLEDFILPAPLPDRIYRKVMTCAEESFRVLGCSGYARVDTRVTDGGYVYILEVNTLPGLTELSYLPKIAEWRGIKYDALVEKILLTASLKGR
jgi:D-alanine-D-alanine ligase